MAAAAREDVALSHPCHTLPRGSAPPSSPVTSSRAVIWEFEAPGARGTPAAKLVPHFLPWTHSLGSLQPDTKHGTAGAGVGAVIRLWGVLCVWLEVGSGCRVLGGLCAALTLSFVSPAHPHWHDAQRGAGAAPKQRQSTATHQTPGEQWHSLAGAWGHGHGQLGLQLQGHGAQQGW